MKIAIEIDNVTPEQGARLMKTALGIEEEKLRAMAHKPADSLPTGSDDLGACRDCEDHGKNFEHCDKCAPPVKKEAKAVSGKVSLKKVALSGKKTKAKGPMRPGNQKGKDLGIPAGLYGQDKGLYQRVWYRCSKKGMTYEQALAAEKKTDPDNVASTSGQSNDDVPKPDWTLEEDAAIRECPTEDMALTHFQNKFPESEKTAVQVSVRWQALRGSQEEETAGEEA